MAKRKMIVTSEREQDQEVGPSRTRKRAESKAKEAALFALAKQLGELPPRKLAELELEPNVQVELERLRDMGNTSAKARQRRLVCQLLRSVDADDVSRRAGRLVRSVSDDAERHELERWRDRLLSEPQTALAEFLEHYPSTDRQQLRQLLRSAETEQAAGDEKRQYRSLYQFLRDTRRAESVL